MKKILLGFWSLLLVTSIFSVPVFASEQENRGSLLSQYSDAYLEEVVYLANHIIEVDEKYQLDIDESQIEDKELFQEMLAIVEALNDSAIIEVLDDEIKVKQEPAISINELGFSNRYWWGFTYTLVKSDLQWIAGAASAIGGLVALAKYIPELTWSKALVAAGSILSAVGGVLAFAKLNYLSFSVLHTGHVWVSAQW